MHDFITNSALLASHFLTVPSARLFHYTSPEALISIVSNKELWATNTMFLNDSKEFRHVGDKTEQVISHIFEHEIVNDEEIHLLTNFKQHVHSVAQRYYIPLSQRMVIRYCNGGRIVQPLGAIPLAFRLHSSRIWRVSKFSN